MKTTNYVKKDVFHLTQKTYKFTFPFKGKVKTQLVISKNRLIKPKSVKAFEFSVRTILMAAFPIEMRPIDGYLQFTTVHYTTYKRDADGTIVPALQGDLDNLYKTLADCFEPVSIKKTLLDENGEMVLTASGKPKYTKEIVTPGVIVNDRRIVRGNMLLSLVEDASEERIEIYVKILSEKELFNPPLPKDSIEL